MAMNKGRVVHCRLEPFDVYIGRPSKWGNRFVIGKDGDRAEVIQKYEAWLWTQPQLIEEAKAELAGKVLGCWCKTKTDPNQACHGDVLASIANGWTTLD
jgi:hypothetical protein